jgi:hypothetical protein
MNLAIIIGVSKYAIAGPLPGCTLDAHHMRDLLIATGKYRRIITITERTNSAQIKAALKSIEDHYKNESVDELFFYFSGHGVFKEQALFCCSDFNPAQPEETSIENSLIDRMFRSINPRLAVKILDACHSGEPYIKGPNDALKKALCNQPLESFICMASSRYNQPSVATPQGSVFTNRWIDSALRHKKGFVRYSSIQEDLARAFAKDRSQTPFFVNQGHGMDIFSKVTHQMNLLAKKLWSYIYL